MSDGAKKVPGTGGMTTSFKKKVSVVWAELIRISSSILLDDCFLNE